MARYTGADCRRCRREKMKLFLKGSKCESPKCPIEIRPYPPGEHGRGRTKDSEYLLQVVVTPADQQSTIAVLPFVNMSRDPDDEYFSDGLAEELINSLTRIRELRVLSRAAMLTVAQSG